MSRALAAGVVALLVPPGLVAGCPACRRDAERHDVAKQSDEGERVDGRPHASVGPEHVVFAGEGWTGARGPCTENMTAEGCDSEWRHGATKQLVRVFFVPTPDPNAMKAFDAKLNADLQARGALVSDVEQGGAKVTRFLERARVAADGGSLDVASLSYVLRGRDQKGIHLITSIVPFDDQEAADARLRALIDTASWSQ